MANGLFGLLGRPGGTPPPRPRPGATAPVRPVARPGAFPGRPAGGAQYGTPTGAQSRMPNNFAEGGEVDGAPDVSPDLKLAAYELLECLDSSRYGNEKGGRAEAFAKALLAFVHLADAEPHAEGEHTDDAEPAGDEDYEE